MAFKEKISSRQISSICLFVVGIIILFNRNTKVLQVIGLICIITSISEFVSESVRRYKILNPKTENRYDSKAEQEVADYFKRKNIIFHHHPQIKLDQTYGPITIPFKKILVEPDFFLPEFEVYVEYWGLIDNPEYKKNSYDKKKKLYKDNDIDFISLYPKNLSNLDWDFTCKLLELFKKREGNQRNWR